jgi:hypothetical protein
VRLSPLPKREFGFDSGLDPDVAARRVAQATDATMRGRVDRRAFKVRRKLRYVNPFQPVAVGRVDRHEGGCRVYGFLRLRGAVAVLTAVWLLAVAFATLVLAGAAKRGDASWSAPVVAGVFLAFGLVLAHGLFRHEIRATLAELESVTRASGS